MNGRHALLWRGWLGQVRRHPGRVLMSVAVVATGVALGLAVDLVNRSALAEFDASLARINGEPDLSLRARAGAFDDTLYARLLEDSAIAEASPVAQASAQLRAAGTEQWHSMPLLGIDPMRAAGLSPSLVPLAGLGEHWFTNDTLFLSRSAIEALALKTGDPLEVRSGTLAWRMRLAGVLPAIPPGQHIAVTDIATMQWRFGWNGKLDRIDLRLSDGVSRGALARRLATEFPALSVSAPEDAGRRTSSLSRAYRVNLSLLAMVALLTGVYLVHSNITLATRRQWPEYALLAMLGAPRRWLFGAVLGQGLIIGILGALLGCVAGTALAAILLELMGADFGAGYFGALRSSLQIPFTALMIFALLGVAAGISGALQPALAARRIAPARAIRGLDDTALHSSGPGRGLTLAALGLGAAALALPPVAELPVGAYLAIALWLWAVVSRIGWLVARCGAWLDRRHMAFARWPGAWIAMRRIGRHPAGAGAAMAGVVASFALAAAMAIMVHSFRHSVEQWLDRVLPADIYARSPADAGPQATIAAETIAAIARHADVAGVSRMRILPLGLDRARPAVALLARDIDPRSVHQSLALIDSSVPVAPGCVALYGSEAMADLYGWVAGEQVTLALGPTDQCFIVAGIWRDYARQHGAIAIALSDYRALSGDRAITDLAITRSADAPPAADLIASLRASSPQADALQWRSVDEIRAISLRVFDRSFAATYALEAVAILIGVLGVAGGYAAEALARQREFGVLVHLGFTHARLAGMLAIEAAITVAIGAAIGLGLGAALAMVLIKRVNPVSFHWRMDVDWPLGLLGASALILILLAATSAALVALRLGTRSPLAAVRADW